MLYILYILPKNLNEGNMKSKKTLGKKYTKPFGKEFTVGKSFASTTLYTTFFFTTLQELHYCTFSTAVISVGQTF